MQVLFHLCLMSQYTTAQEVELFSSSQKVPGLKSVSVNR